MTPTPDQLAEIGRGIIALAKAAPSSFPLVQAPWSMTTCRHVERNVDVRARTVTCRACGVALDPIVVLDDIAKDASWVLHMRLEKRKLTEECAALKIEASRLRAAAKRRKGTAQ
jgi:hypothetical protein